MSGVHNQPSDSGFNKVTDSVSIGLTKAGKNISKGIKSIKTYIGHKISDARDNKVAKKVTEFQDKLKNEVEDFGDASGINDKVKDNKEALKSKMNKAKEKAKSYEEVQTATEYVDKGTSAIKGKASGVWKSIKGVPGKIAKHAERAQIRRDQAAINNFHDKRAQSDVTTVTPEKPNKPLPPTPPPKGSAATVKPVKPHKPLPPPPQTPPRPARPPLPPLPTKPD